MGWEYGHEKVVCLLDVYRESFLNINQYQSFFVV